jgi:hypothetical protein
MKQVIKRVPLLLALTNWVDLLTFTNQGSVTPIQDVGVGNYSQRFYRVAMP